MIVRRLLGLVTTVVGLLAVPAVAVGAVVAKESFVPMSGPQLVAGGAVFARSDLDGGFTLNLAPTAGGATRVIQAFDGKRRELVLSPELNTAPRRIGLEVQARGDFRPTLQTFQGALGETLMALTEPCDLIGRGDVGEIGVSDDRAAHSARECSSPPGPDVLTDFSSGEPVDMELPGATGGDRVAGPFVSYASPSGYTVFDTRRGSIVNRIPFPRSRDPQRRLVGVDLREDGALLFSWRTSESAFVSFAEPGASRATRLRLPKAQYYAAKFAGEGVVVSRADDLQVRYRLLSTGAIPNARLELRDVRGRFERLLAANVDDEYGDEHFDVQDGQLSFVRRTCRGAEIHVQPLSDPTRRFKRAADCPLDLLAPPTVSRSGKRVRVVVSCRGMTGDCLPAWVRAKVGRERNEPRERHVTFAPQLGPTPTAGGAVFLVLLRRRDQRWLRQGRPLTVRMAVGLEDLSDFNASERGIAQRRSGTFTVRADPRN